MLDGTRYECELNELRQKEVETKAKAEEDRRALEIRMGEELALRIEQAKAEASQEARLQVGT